jgi:hypothetical protein
MIKFRPVLRSREEFGELDEIVVQLFDDLGSGNTAPRKVSRAGEGNASVSRRGNSRRAPLSAAEGERGGVNLARGQSCEENEPEDPSVGSSSFDRDDGGDVFFNEEAHPDRFRGLSVTDKELVERTVAELASRPHAYILLELISDGLVSQKADIPLDGPAAIDGDEKPVQSPGAANAKPASDRKET